ncbi:fructose-bisphosphatase class I [Candidatus Peregrinibacteria bacterium]|nr:fructose-bisphosphatase class I [Candidatus Peregrinibacteria bacterium]
MKTFSDYLEENDIDYHLYGVLNSLKDVVKKVSDVIKTAETGSAGSKNIFGEEQLALDILADGFVQKELQKNSLIGIIASEELPEEMDVSNEETGGGEYGVCYDPLDGSSLVDVNLAVGSIFGIYKMPNSEGKNSFIGVKGDEQLASMIAVYGPRTTIVLTVKRGVVEFLLDDGEFYLVREGIKVGGGKMFAPGNLRACASRKDYLELINYWCEKQFTLRYSGGMVPDINQILLKGKGIFSYPGYGDAPDGKLRLLFECAPMALLMEQAGGAATDGSMRILDKKLTRLDQRTPIFIGSKEEVERCEKYL